MVVLYDNDFGSIINVYFFGTFSNLTSQKYTLALHSLDTLSDIRIKASCACASLLIKARFLWKSKPTLLSALITFVNNFQNLISFSFNYLVLIIVCIGLYI
jgi:hypothetical protein